MKVAFQLTGFIYVNNTNITILNEGQETAEEVVARAQLMLDTWHRELSYTRGDLKESKCFWTIQDYTWKDGKYLLVKDTQLQLVIKQNQ